MQRNCGSHTLLGAGRGGRGAGGSRGRGGTARARVNPEAIVLHPRVNPVTELECVTLPWRLLQEDWPRDGGLLCGSAFLHIF